MFLFPLFVLFFFFFERSPFFAAPFPFRRIDWWGSPHLLLLQAAPAFRSLTVQEGQGEESEWARRFGFNLNGGPPFSDVMESLPPFLSIKGIRKKKNKEERRKKEREKERGKNVSFTRDASLFALPPIKSPSVHPGRDLVEATTPPSPPPPHRMWTVCVRSFGRKESLWRIRRTFFPFPLPFTPLMHFDDDVCCPTKPARIIFFLDLSFPFRFSSLLPFFFGWRREGEKLLPLPSLPRSGRENVRFP
ncbi:hypothetical protein IE53DRAFT_184658 [Violaceomyces palustris]|uniref:Uncharacterized protein n=1 Tax=Violaceomyces palustris TaxID=1673888 RepID=A0ACD0NS76_9BASI|nr:hypothetical protein IE53DRAFT_184658 [Violaceomyces palustris]